MDATLYCILSFGGTHLIISHICCVSYSIENFVFNFSTHYSLAGPTFGQPKFQVHSTNSGLDLQVPVSFILEVTAVYSNKYPSLKIFCSYLCSSLEKILLRHQDMENAGVNSHGVMMGERVSTEMWHLQPHRERPYYELELEVCLERRLHYIRGRL